jgi:lysophospholipase L1-like esterase
MKKVQSNLAVVTLMALLTLASSLYADKTKNILVFGDSLTWGWSPSKPIIPTVRHKLENRWTTVMEKNLGEKYHIIVEGLSGRTTNIDDPNNPTLNGAPYLKAALASHEPLDLVIIMLGTNDTKHQLQRSAFEIGLGMGELINIVQKHSASWNRTNYPSPKVLVISPPPLGENLAPILKTVLKDGYAKSKKLATIYSAITATAQEHFFDAGSVISSDGIDGVHFTAKTNKKLGETVAKEVKKILTAK